MDSFFFVIPFFVDRGKFSFSWIFDFVVVPKSAYYPIQNLELDEYWNSWFPGNLEIHANWFQTNYSQSTVLTINFSLSVFFLWIRLQIFSGSCCNCLTLVIFYVYCFVIGQTIGFLTWILLYFFIFVHSLSYFTTYTIRVLLTVVGRTINYSWFNLPYLVSDWSLFFFGSHHILYL